MLVDELVIFTNNLEAQYAFYVDTLNISAINKTKSSFSLLIGKSVLTFQYHSYTKPYHFAINIPSNKEEEALVWLKKKVVIQKFHNEEIIDFINWNAKSIYFYDPDKNVVEFIARKNLNINTYDIFSSKQLLRISEIGMSVHNVNEIFVQLNEMQETPLYFGNTEWFCAAGDEYGLFIIIDQSKKGWMPNNDFAYTSDFKLRGTMNFDFVNGEVITA